MHTNVWMYSKTRLYFLHFSFLWNKLWRKSLVTGSQVWKFPATTARPDNTEHRNIFTRLPTPNCSTYTIYIFKYTIYAYKNMLCLETNNKIRLTYIMKLEFRMSNDSQNYIIYIYDDLNISFIFNNKIYIIYTIPK